MGPDLEGGVPMGRGKVAGRGIVDRVRVQATRVGRDLEGKDGEEVGSEWELGVLLQQRWGVRGGRVNLVGRGKLGRSTIEAERAVPEEGVGRIRSGWSLHEGRGLDEGRA